jgi:hypothetical protein
MLAVIRKLCRRIGEHAPLTGILGNAELLLAEMRRQNNTPLSAPVVKRLESIAALAVACAKPFPGSAGPSESRSIRSGEFKRTSQWLSAR